MKKLKLAEPGRPRLAVPMWGRLPKPALSGVEGAVRSSTARLAFSLPGTVHAHEEGHPQTSKPQVGRSKSAIFTNPKHNRGLRFTSTRVDTKREKPRLARVLRKVLDVTAQNLVMRLWTARTRLKTHTVTTRDFPLTPKIEGVQQDRSLTPSKFFPVGAASGAQAESLF